MLGALRGLLEREGVEYMDGGEVKDCSYREVVGTGIKNADCA